jgi:hypothetical protein
LVSALMVACSGAAQRPATATVDVARSCPAAVVNGDAELAKVEGCTSIDGDLHISAVSSLEALAELREVHGTLTISDSPELGNLEGLEQLSRVDTLVLQRSGVFTTVGLDGLREIGRLAIAENPRLISAAGLNHVRAVREVVITDNPRLTAYFGLLPALEHNPIRVSVQGNRGISTTDSAALSQQRVASMTAAVAR